MKKVVVFSAYIPLQLIIAFSSDLKTVVCPSRVVLGVPWELGFALSIERSTRSWSNELRILRPAPGSMTEDFSVAKEKLSRNGKPRATPPLSLYRSRS